MSFWDTDFGTFIIIVAQCLAVVVGVMVAVALLPPLVVAGCGLSLLFLFFCLLFFDGVVV